MQFFGKLDGMANTIEKIGIAEGNVLRAGGAPCWRMSCMTTSRLTIRKTPLYTGTIGQWRHKCLQPRLFLSSPSRRRKPPLGTMRWAYLPMGGIPERSGTSNVRRSIETRGSGCGDG